MTLRRLYVHGAGRRGALASDTTTHVVLTGAAHRAQDAPGFGAVVAAFESELMRA
ncbi:hypothetical protein [Microbacterium alcoholitolerans]|uniref:hypothetical protein n=1 Tax=unclassified Microbacterium TaxID=2609290 RepID=UPI003D184A64